MNASTFVVTTAVHGKTRTTVWNSSKPLKLGHLLGWTLEQHQGGLRVKGKQTIALPKFTDGAAEIDLPETGKLRIRQTRGLKAAFEQPSSKGGELRVYSCLGDWILSSSNVEQVFAAMASERKIFDLAKEGNDFKVASHVQGLTFRGQDGKSTQLDQAARIGAADLKTGSIHFEGFSWRFFDTSSPTIAESGVVAKEQDDEIGAFNKALQAAGGALLLLTAIAFFWPKGEKKEELIPPQFAKVVLSKPKVKAGSASGAGATAQNQAAKQEKASVVQAFRAKALKNAVSGLLKGGMTTLLAQSDFVSGSQASANAKRMFDAKSDALAPTAPTTGIMNGRQVAVNSVGGSGGGQGGKGVGYGKGEHAGVKGQGQAFVAFDAAGASVDEGLTKDEVGEVIHRHMSEVRYCYESAMIRQPDVEGKLITSFTINGQGIVASSAVKDSTLPDPRLDDCILRRLASWKFPLPRGGVDVSVTYPFVFKTLGR